MIDHPRLVEALRLEIVHQVIGVVRRLMAHRALAFAEEYGLAAQLSGRCFGTVDVAEHVELRCRREVEHLLEFRHLMDLAAAIENVHPFLGRDDMVAVEVRGALLELGKVLHRLQRTLRAKQSLDVHAAQRRGVDAVAELLRADVADQMRRAIGMAVGMAIEAGDTAARLVRWAIFGWVELLRSEGGHPTPRALR